MKFCPTCGKPFVPDSERSVYCAPACKKRAQNRRYYQRHRKTVIRRVIERRK